MKNHNFEQYEDSFINEESFTNKEFLVGLLAGAAVGMVAGILLAPRSGKDTLDKISGAVSNKADVLSGQLEKAKSAAGKAMDKVASKTNAVADQAGNKVDDFADKAEDKVSDVSDEAGSIVDRLKSQAERY